MAIEFARVRYVKRSDGGNACRSAAYNARSDVRCERTRERFFFGHRDGLLHHEILLPEGADERFRDAATLWNEAQAMERRKDSQEAREVLLALPSDPELGLEHWREMAAEFARDNFVAKGLAVQIDIHAPHEGEVNVHAHMLVTTRRIEGDRFAAHKARDLDPEVRRLKGGRSVVTEGEAWGVLWRDYQNLYFERQGLELRVDEIGPVAQTHEGPVRMRTAPDESSARLAATRVENEAKARDPAWLLEKLTERRATFTEMDIERLIKKFVPDLTERAAIRAELIARPEVVALHERETGAFAGRYTTTEVRAEERDVVEAAEKLATARKAVTGWRSQIVAKKRGLDQEQRAAFLKATGTDGFVVIEGLAGAGKSHSLSAIREAHERAGWRAIGLAPTNVAAEDLRRQGFRHGSTAHLELFFQENRRYDRAPQWDRRTLVIVDEAAMMDTRTYARLMRHAAETGAKVVLAGDDRQLTSVQRGGMFTTLKERHGSAVISKVRRQEQDWQRAASEDFAGGRVAEGLRAYAERGHVHWSADLDESRSRLLSDWDQASRERPGINRFVYASTNFQVNRLNRDLRDIRVKRGEVRDELEVETVKGKLAIGAGDRIQFHGNDRKAGIYNGSLATIEKIQGGIITARTDTGRVVSFNVRDFDQFGLGYAGTVYRGQGKTQTEVYALYDNAFAWNARTAYVGLTRHKAKVELYVSRDLAPDEITLGILMAHRTRDEASLTWATEAEIVELGKKRDERGGEGRGGRSGRGDSGAPAGAPAVGVPDAKRGEHEKSAESPSLAKETPAADAQAFPREQMERLRQLDLTIYARDVHGYQVRPRREHGEFALLRETADGKIDVLHARKAKDGHWTYINPVDPKDRGDIFDFAKREGQPDLRAAREAVAAYDIAMRDPNRHKKAAEEKARPDIPKDAPDRDLREAGAEIDRAREIAGAEHEDRREAAGLAEEERQQFFRDEAARVQRLDQEAAQARDTEQQRLHQIDKERPPGHEAYVEAQKEQVADARMARAAPAAEVSKHEAETRESPTAGVPTPAQMRYTEALAQHYDPRAPIASLAQASLAEAAAYQRDRHELDQRIAAQTDPDRRDALMVRRDIEHADHMAQAYGRVAGLARATGAKEITEYEKRVQDYKEQGREAREIWAERGQDRPDLYPPLNPELDRKQEQVREPSGETREQPAQTRPTQARTPEEERRAMAYLDLPAHAVEKHGYKLDWENDERNIAVLSKGDERLTASQDRDGAWSYKSRDNYHDRGDIVEFEARRGAKTFTKARENLRPELERAEREHGPLNQQRSQERARDMERDDDLGRERTLPEHDGPDGPEHDPKRRRGRVR